jgi:tetratricopeptide (TPR) repeat protein
MQPQPRYRKGDRIGGRYRVHQALMGGMGEVYLCLDLVENAPFALKTFQARYLTNPRIRELFAQEVGTWVALEKHPNIVRCFDMRPLDNQPFMRLEWVAGEEDRGTDLRSWLYRGPLELRLALDITIDLCRALIHAQTKQPGIVHRDLKPENILVAQGRVAKITDFGLASLVQQTGLQLELERNITSGRQTMLGARGVVGTPPYMAPELWRGEHADIRTDIYAIGCILYELLTGAQPYQATTLEGFERLHTTAVLPIIATTNRLPSTLNALLARCLAKQLDDRFASVDALLDALAQLYQAQRGTEPRPLPTIGILTAVDYTNRGNTYEKLGRFAEALADHTRAITLDPTFAMAFYNRGITYTKLGQFDEALADHTQAIALDPADARAYANRGNTYEQLGRYDEALADLDHALILDPAHTPAYSNRGITYTKLGRFDEALADHTQAITLDPALAPAYINRGATYTELGRFDDALADYSQAITLDPALAPAYYNLGTIYAMLGRFDDALADYSQAITLDPALAPVYYSRGVLYRQRGRLAMALADFDRTIALDPTYAPAYTNRGATYTELGRFNDALADHTRAIALDPTDATAFYKRGTAYAKLKRFEEALADFTRAVDIDPADAIVYTNRGHTYIQLGQFEKALADFDHAIECDPANASAYNNRGNTCKNLGRYDEALTDYTHALALDPTDASAYYNRGDMYRTLGRFEEALADFDRAIECDPALAQAYNNRGTTYAQLGRFEEALADYDRAIKCDPALTLAYTNRGFTYEQLDRVEEALADYDRAIKCDPTDAQPYLYFGALLANRGQLRAALPYLEEAARLGHPQGRSSMARVRQMLGGEQADEGKRVQQAFDVFQRAKSLTDLQQAVKEFPFMTNPQFLVLVEQVISEQVPLEHRPALEERLTGLREIAAKQR